MPAELIIALILILVAASAFISFKFICKKKSKLHVDKNNFEGPHLSTDKCDDTFRNEIIMSNIESLILKNQNGYEVTLTRPNTDKLSSKKYREICVRSSDALGQATQGAMPILAQAYTLSEIAKAAPNRLFTATAPVQDLMKLSNGTVGSAVMKDGRITAQAGFSEVAVNVVNPAMVIGGVMQAMALVSGQYYMDEISKQLKGLNQKLNKLIGYHHDEKIGILRNINRGLKEMATKTKVDAADIIVCQRLVERSGDVYFEYKTRLEGVNVNSKERWLNKTGELKDLGQSIDDSELNFTLQMCYHASSLLEKCRLAEISLRLKIGAGQEDYIAERIFNLQEHSAEAFHRNIQQHIDAHYLPILDKTERIVEAAKVPLLFGNASEAANNIQQRKKDISDLVVDDGTVVNLVDKMVTMAGLLFNPKETIIMLGDTPETQRIFVSDGEE